MKEMRTSLVTTSGSRKFIILGAGVRVIYFVRHIRGRGGGERCQDSSISLHKIMSQLLGALPP